ncbi:hypothetical protein PENARI_c337G09945, partial [Penicillium arizonense]
DSDDPKNDEFYVLDEDSDQSELFSTASRAEKAEIQRCEDQSIVLLAEAAILSTESSLLALPSIQDIESTPAQWLESPTSLREAKASPFWLWWEQAMKSEIAQFEVLQVWQPASPPPGAKILSGRWVYKLKTDANGRPAKFKARWVARGNTQREGIDYEDAYAATGRYETLRVLLAVITLKKLYSTHLDVNLAYLNAILEEETYMQYPDGLDFHGVEPHGNVCRLRKSLYGLRQSAANWYKTLSSFLLSKGFNASSSDPCLYVRHEQGGGITIIFVYVDDMLLASTSPTTLQRVKEAIAKQWSISDLGEVSHYLSLKIQRDREAGIMKIGQKAYIDKFPDVPATSPRPFIPFSPSTELRKADEPANRENVKTYQSLTGSLIYASTVSRPDLSLALGMLTKHNLKPHDPHFSAVYQAVQYAKRTSNLTITYGRPKTSGNT